MNWISRELNDLARRVGIPILTNGDWEDDEMTILLAEMPRPSLLPEGGDGGADTARTTTPQDDEGTAPPETLVPRRKTCPCPATAAAAATASAPDALRRLYALYHLTAAMLRRYGGRTQTLDCARLQAVTGLARRFISLQNRVRRMEVNVISSGVVTLKLDLMKYVAPRRPIETYMSTVTEALRGWVCRHRMRQHRNGTRAYPLHRIRYSDPNSSLSGFTWINPKHRRRWGRLLIRDSTKNRVPNMPTHARPPSTEDWVHMYLTGQYLMTSNSKIASSLPEHRSAAKAYNQHLLAGDWLRLTQTAWKFEYETYLTRDFYHDFHMGFIIDRNTRRVANQMNRVRRVRAQEYQNEYLRRIRIYERALNKR